MRGFLRSIVIHEAKRHACARHIIPEQQLPRAEWERRAKAAHDRGARQRKCSGCDTWFWSWEWLTG